MSSIVSALGELYASQGVQGRALLPIIAAAALLFLLALAFALFAVRTRVSSMWEERRRARLEALWTEPMLEALEGERDPEEVTKRVGPRDHRRFLAFLLPYARLVVGEHQERAVRLAAPFLDEVEPGLYDRNPFRRARAAQTIGTLGLPERGEALVQLLDDPSPLVAMVAAQALARSGRPDHARAFVQRLDRFEDWSQGHLVHLLRLIGPGVVPELRAMLREGETVPTPTRTVAVDALRALHDVEAADMAPRLLSAESDQNLLTALLRLVAELGRPDHLEAVRPHLDSRHFPVRAAAFQALGALGAREDLRRLLEGVEDPSPWVAWQAARGAELCGGREALRALVASHHWRATLAAEVIGKSVP